METNGMMPGVPGTVVRAPSVVVAHHGCHRDSARAITEGGDFRPSRKAYDWLADGFYWFEYGPDRARAWAEERFGSDGVVLQGVITLGHCLNLLDTAHGEDLQKAYEAVQAKLTQGGKPMPENREGGRHYLDRAVLEFYCNYVERVARAPFQTVRGCFPEGGPIFPGSRILRETHIQIAVRDPSCISSVELVNLL